MADPFAGSVVEGGIRTLVDDYVVEVPDPETFDVDRAITLLQISVDRHRAELESRRIEGGSGDSGRRIVFRVDGRFDPAAIVEQGNLAPSRDFGDDGNSNVRGHPNTAVGSATVEASNVAFRNWLGGGNNHPHSVYQYAFDTRGYDVAGWVDGDGSQFSVPDGGRSDHDNLDEVHFETVPPDRVYLLNSEDPTDRRWIAELAASQHSNPNYGVPLSTFLAYREYRRAEPAIAGGNPAVDWEAPAREALPLDAIADLEDRVGQWVLDEPSSLSPLPSEDDPQVQNSQDDGESRSDGDRDRSPSPQGATGSGPRGTFPEEQSEHEAALEDLDEIVRRRHMAHLEQGGPTTSRTQGGSERPKPPIAANTDPQQSLGEAVAPATQRTAPLEQGGPTTSRTQSGSERPGPPIAATTDPQQSRGEAPVPATQRTAPAEQGGPTTLHTQSGSERPGPPIAATTDPQQSRGEAPVSPTASTAAPVDGPNPAPAPVSPRERLWQLLAQPYDEPQRNDHIRAVGEAIMRVTSTSAEECRAAFMDNPRAPAQLARLLQRQGPEHTGSTAELAHIAGTALGMAARQQLSAPGGAQKIVEQLTAEQPTDLPSDVLGGHEHSALSISALGRGRPELAPWTRMTLQSIPQEVPALMSATIDVTPNKQQSLEKVSRKLFVGDGTEARKMVHSSLPSAHDSLNTQLEAEQVRDQQRRDAEERWRALPHEQRWARPSFAEEQEEREARYSERAKADAAAYRDLNIARNREVAAERAADRRAHDESMRASQDEREDRASARRQVDNRLHASRLAAWSLTAYAQASAKKPVAAAAEPLRPALLPPRQPLVPPSPTIHIYDSTPGRLQDPSWAEARPSRPPHDPRQIDAPPSSAFPTARALMEPGRDTFVPTFSVDEQGQAGLRARSASNTSLFIAPLQAPSNQPGTRIMGAVAPPARPSALETTTSSSTARVDQRPVLTSIRHHPDSGMPGVLLRSDYGAYGAVAWESGFSVQRSDGNRLDVHPVPGRNRQVEDRDMDR